MSKISVQIFISEVDIFQVFKVNSTWFLWWTEFLIRHSTPVIIVNLKAGETFTYSLKFLEVFNDKITDGTDCESNVVFRALRIEFVL